MSSVYKTGKLILILGPSGSGKGTVLEYLKKRHPEFFFPLSCTTREKRPQEVEGDVYYFVSREEFEERLNKGEFLEYAAIHGAHYYGTLKKPITDALHDGRVVIREVDVQGVRSIREILPKEQVMTIFLRAKWDDLKRRILKRAPTLEDELELRHQSFLKEMAWQDECDRVIESREGQIKEVCEAVENVILETL